MALVNEYLPTVCVFAPRDTSRQGVTIAESHDQELGSRRPGRAEREDFSEARTSQAQGGAGEHTDWTTPLRELSIRESHVQQGSDLLREPKPEPYH
jgi:hypothetical protein